MALTLTAAAVAEKDESPAGVRDNALAHLVRSVNLNLERLREEEPDNVDAMAAEYIRLFDAYPDTVEGKLAGFEAFYLFRSASMPYKALGQAGRMRKYYAPGETVPNLFDAKRPVAIAASLRIESARTFLQNGTPLNAVQTLRGASPDERDGTAAYRDDGVTVFGAAGTLIDLTSLDASIAAGETRQAFLTLSDLFTSRGKESIGRDKRTLPLDRELLDRVETIRKLERWELSRALIEFQRIEALLSSSAAKLQLGEMRADAQMRHFAVYNGKTAALEAIKTLTALIGAHGERVETRHLADGIHVTRVGERLLDRIVRIHLDSLDDPRSLVIYLDTASRTWAKDTPFEARVRLHAADLQSRRVGNKDRARVLYKNLLDRHGDLVYYPHVLPDVTRYREIVRERLRGLNGSTP